VGQAAGGDILVEVAVYGGPSRWDQGAKVSARIARELGRI
jgi:hypothetical protein